MAPYYLFSIKSSHGPSHHPKPRRSLGCHESYQLLSIEFSQDLIILGLEGAWDVIKSHINYQVFSCHRVNLIHFLGIFGSKT